MSENTFEFETTNFEKILYLNNTTEDSFIDWINDFVNSHKGINITFGEQYQLIFPNPKNSHLVIWPDPIDNSGRPPFKFPWVLVGSLCRDNADGSTSVGVKLIEALKIKTFQVSNRLQVTMNTNFKAIEDLYLPWLLEGIEKAYPGSTQSQPVKVKKNRSGPKNKPSYIDAHNQMESGSSEDDAWNYWKKKYKKEYEKLRGNDIYSGDLKSTETRCRHAFHNGMKNLDKKKETEN